MEENNQNILPTEAEAVGKYCCGRCDKKSCWKWGFLVVLLFLTASLIYAGYQFSQKQTVVSQPTPVVQPSPTPTLLPAEASAKAGDPTANWKTYANSDLKFSISYPSSLKISQEPKPFKDSNGTSWFLSIDDRKNGDTGGLTIQTDVLVQFSENPINGETGRPITKIEDTSMANNRIFYNIQTYPAAKLIQESEPDKNGLITTASISINILKGKSLWFLSGNLKNTKKENVQLLDQILSTFKFLE